MQNKKKFIFILIAISLVLVTGFFILTRGHKSASVQNSGQAFYYCPMHPNFTSDKSGSCSICGMDLVKKELSIVSTKAVYYCPMHPNFISDKPGSCSICGMDLVKKETSQQPVKEAKKKILYYRNPMNPEVTSPVPMKDSMGMDYVPVYEEETTGEETGVYISPERQQRIGVTKEKVTKRRLYHQILTVGKVAYDPNLYVAQEEYLQALKAFNATKNSALTSISEQSDALVSATEKKLRLLGMSKEQIEELAKNGEAKENLFLPVKDDKVWVYITVYEYEMDLVAAGSEVEVTASAFPGKIFKGKIVAITPVLNAESRSLQVRAEIENPEGKFRPEMFVNAKIKVDLGEKLALPESAVIDTGVRQIVYLAKEDSRVAPREVLLGQRAEGYFEVVEGLQEGDIVITSGNFLVDSESKLNAVLDGSSPEHKHGE